MPAERPVHPAFICIEKGILEMCWGRTQIMHAAAGTGAAGLKERQKGSSQVKRSCCSIGEQNYASR